MKGKQKSTRGVKSIYNDKLAKKICEHIANGLSLRKIQKIEGMPNADTIRKWCLNREDFNAQYVRAKIQQTEAFAEQILEISDKSEDDVVVDSGVINSRRLQIDTRKWLMGKMKPKKYGDSSMLKVADNKGGKLGLGDILSEIDGKTSGL